MENIHHWGCWKCGHDQGQLLRWDWYKRREPPPQILTKKGHASRGSKKDKEVEKTIANPSLKVGNASVKGKLVVEDFGPINSSLLKYSKGNASCEGKQSPATDGPSWVPFESTSKKEQIVRLESSQGLLFFSKTIYPQIK